MKTRRFFVVVLLGALHMMQYHGEINVMIAEKEYRRKGLAKEALRFLL